MNKLLNFNVELFLILGQVTKCYVFIYLMIC